MRESFANGVASKSTTKFKIEMMDVTEEMEDIDIESFSTKIK